MSAPFALIFLLGSNIWSAEKYLDGDGFLQIKESSGVFARNCRWTQLKTKHTVELIFLTSIDGQFYYDGDDANAMNMANGHGVMKMI